MDWLRLTQNIVKDWMLSPWDQEQGKDVLLLFLLNTVPEVLASAIREEEEINGMQIEKEEIKLPLCKHDMVVYLESCEGSTEKLLELINEFSKIAR